MRRRANDLARPLLDIRRSDLEDYLADRSLTPRRDPTNDDPRFARNRLRQILLPAIDAFEPSARRLLAQTAEILGDEDNLLEDQVDQLAAGMLEDRAAFDALPPVLQRRLLRRRHPEAGFLDIEARRRHGLPDAAPIPAPPPKLLVSTCACDPAAFRARDSIGHLDGDRVQLPLRVATRSPGDRMRPLGMDQAKRLQDILVDARVPRHLRDTLPIVSDREEIVWIPAVSVAERKRVTAETRRQLHLEIVSG